MWDEWMPALQLGVTPEQFRQLPRHPAYLYEYLNGIAYLSPRPRTFHAILDLNASLPPDLPPRSDVVLRAVGRADRAELVVAFASAFDQAQPFAGLDEARRREAARQVLDRTFAGGDGPWIADASFAAWQEGPALSRPRLVGAMLVTLVPGGDPADRDSYLWMEPPPPDCLERRLGQPHLTWVFVVPDLSRRGVATSLLAAVRDALRRRGYSQLLSTFMSGNEASVLWHWRQGFRLVEHPGAGRRWRRAIAPDGGGPALPRAS
ncbi:MAG: GNAT family N-acetyltransferase [Gemmataceae bacterium]|nr:GNAT family N-acetyltransferase [Gemmataceae bacterium]MDW8265835.1 GNAT family N-acetyltransferase [Gemmataceae bacterium]